MKKEFNRWFLLNLSNKEIFIGFIIFVASGIFFRGLGGFIWRSNEIVLRDKTTILRPDINELTIQEYQIDLDTLQLRLNSLNNDFLTENKEFKENSERFRSINKMYLELMLRLNHIIGELEKDTNKHHRTNKIKVYEEHMEKMKQSIELLNDELKRENDASQSYTLNMITLIELIFLPIGVVVGYFGMNFSSMGGHVGKGHKPAPGILGFKYGQAFFWLLILLVSLFVFYNFDFNKLEHFEGCEVSQPYAYNEEFLRSRELRKENVQFRDITALPYDDIYFYKYI